MLGKYLTEKKDKKAFALCLKNEFKVDEGFANRCYDGLHEWYTRRQGDIEKAMRREVIDKLSNVSNVSTGNKEVR